MDWLKRLIQDNTPAASGESSLTTRPNPVMPTPAPQVDLSSPDNTGIRNLLATINQYRDPETMQIDPRRMKDNQSFEGMNNYPMDIAPMIKAMPDQTPATEAPMSKIGEKPAVVAPTVKKAKPVTSKEEAKPEPDKSAEALVAEAKAKPDALEALGLKDIKPADDQEMADALKQQGDNRMLFNMNKAFNQIGAGIGQVKADPTHGDFLKDSIDAPVKDIKTKRDAEKEIEQRERERQKFVMDKADFKNRQDLASINIEKAKMELSDDKMRSDANSDASKLARQSTRDTLLRMGRKDLANGVKDNMSAEQLNKLFGSMSLSNMVTAYEAQQSRLEVAKTRAEEAKIRQQEKVDAKDVTRLDQASKLIAADLARGNTAFGKNANIVRAADAIQTLAGTTPPDKLTNQQIAEIAKNLDAMLAMGAATVSGTDKLSPKGWGSKAATVTEFLTNNPAAARQGGYVTQALHTIEREKALAQRKIKDTSNSLLGSYLDLGKKHPESWNAMLKGHGINPDEIGVTKEKEPQAGALQLSNEQQVDLAAELKRRGQ